MITLKHHDEYSDVSMSINKKRILNQILDYLSSHLGQSQWNDVFPDGVLGRYYLVTVFKLIYR